MTTPKLNILMLNYEFPPIGGGGGNAHLNLLKEYAKSNQLNVTVLTSAPTPGLYEENFADNIKIYKVGIHKKSLHHWRKTEVIEWLFKAGRYYKKLIKKENYDLIHAFFGFPTGWLCYKTRKKLPYIISFRGSDVPGQNARLATDYKILAPVFRSIWKNASALIACSEGLKQRALNFLPTVTIDTIPNGVDLERFNPSKPAPKNEVLKLITTGRLSPTKRVEILIQTVETLLQQNQKVHLTIAGGGSMLSELQEIIKQKNLENSIDLKGRIDPEKMPALYQQSNIFISATMQEGMSNAMLEAMASGLPIVTTACEGLTELIEDNGIIVDSPTPQAISNAIISLTSDTNKLNQTASAARTKAQQFSWSKVADQYIEQYRKVKK